MIHLLGLRFPNSSPVSFLHPASGTGLWPSPRPFPVHFSIISMSCVHCLNTTCILPTHSFLYPELSFYPTGISCTLILLTCTVSHPLSSLLGLNSIVNYYNHSFGKTLNFLALSHFTGITYKTIIMVKSNSANSTPVPV